MVATMSLMLTGVPDAKSTVSRAPFGFHQLEKAVDRVIDVHEVDQVLAVAANDESPLAARQRLQPLRRDLAGRLVRPVGAKEADVDIARHAAAALAEKLQILLGRELRDRVRQLWRHRRRRRHRAVQPV
jgi:hypothetical protein